MHDRSLLGPADVTDDQLTEMVADLLGHDRARVDLVSSTAATVAYDLPALTTAGRYWVSGLARTPAGTVPFRIFVKHVQSWTRTTFFEDVPPEHRDLAAVAVPWRTEPAAYRSDLGDRLPAGLVMPRALGVFDLDEESAAIWIEGAEHPPVPWDLARYQRAAYLLGRMATSARVAPLRNVGSFDWTFHQYVHGRLGAQVLPVLRDGTVWEHPILAATFDDDLRGRLLAAADRVPELAGELASYPMLTAHGDASPNNLLAGPTPDSFVLIDYGFWVPNPLGFDLGQLLVGDVQLGRRSADLLAETDAAIVAAYTEGLADEGMTVPESDVRRAHALHLLLFSGLSALPFEMLDGPSDDLSAVAPARAALATFSLDLLDATS